MDIGYATAQLKRIETHRRWLLHPPAREPDPADKAAWREWQQYREWQARRNAARAEGEARFGYDVKHGAHLYRLLKMGREILLNGQVHVWRGGRDADVIQAIRAGEWPYERLVGWAKEADAELGEIVAARRHVVPDAPDRDAIDALCVEVVERAIGCVTAASTHDG